ncbi:MAG: helix-turn-helix domain-containing protein [Actinomycetota bacterium]|nr:helix-turn-helix domain-containing protein [Actinomycetota bacterium]
MSTRPAPRYLTPNDVAADLQVSSMTVYRLIHSGDLPAVRIGRSFRVATTDLNTFLEANAAPMS